MYFKKIISMCNQCIVYIADMLNMALRQRHYHSEKRPDQEGRPLAAINPPEADEVRSEGRIQLRQKLVIGLLCLLILACASCVWKYIDFCQKGEELRLQHEQTLKEKEMQYKHEKEIEEAKIEAESRMQETIAMEEIKLESERQAEREMNEMKLKQHKIDMEKQKEIQKEQLQIDKTLRETEMSYAHEQQLKQMQLSTIEQELEAEKLRMERAQILEEKKIEATKELYAKAFDAKVVTTKTHTGFFGGTTKEEVVRLYLDGRMLLDFQGAMNDDRDEDL